MVAFLLLGLLTLIAALLLLRLYAGPDTARLTRATWRTAIAFAVIGVALLVLRVPLGFMFVGVSAILPWTLRRQGPQPAPGAGGSSPGPDSRVETKYLRMVLDHGTGALDGLVLAGRHRDRRLGDLSLAQLLDVRADCLRDDPDGVPLIEAYLDRVHGAAWRAEGAGRQSSDTPPRPGTARMTREEALEVLGLAPTATDAEIREAYHQLIMKLHPDHGGSDYLAAKINQARDVLLGA